MTTEEREEFEGRARGDKASATGIILIILCAAILLVLLSLLICWWMSPTDKKTSSETRATATLKEKTLQLVGTIDDTRRVIEELQKLAEDKDKEIEKLKGESASLKWRAELAEESYRRFKDRLEVEEREKKP